MRIVHCIRAPVGGIFRHVCDLAALQNKAGHAVSLICDSTTGGVLEDATLDRARPDFALGIHRFAMPRDIAPADLSLVWRLTPAIRSLDPDILHAHGSKGGAYARVVGTFLRASGKRVARIYTPHGGSLHFDATSLRGRVYFSAERALGALTDGFVFVSRFEADTFAEKVGKPKKPSAIVYNGLRPDEFAPVAPADDARDFLFIGELRDLKGPDVFLNALAAIRARGGRPPSAVVVGDGPDRERVRALVVELGLAGSVALLSPMPARAAFRLARCLVVPSRKESLPCPTSCSRPPPPQCPRLSPASAASRKSSAKRLPRLYLPAMSGRWLRPCKARSPILARRPPAPCGCKPRCARASRRQPWPRESTRSTRRLQGVKPNIRFSSQNTREFAISTPSSWPFALPASGA